MALVTVGHPIPGLTAYERFDDFSLAFVGGISGRINLTTGQQTQLTGLGYVINPATPAYESPYVLDSELESQLPARLSEVELRAALGSPVLTVAAADSPFPAFAHFVCDGTDDHLTVQAAVDSFPGHVGGVRLRGGEFKFAGAVTLPPRVGIHGEGALVTRIRYSGPAGGRVITTAAFTGSTHPGWTGGLSGFDIIYPEAKITAATKVVYLAQPHAPVDIHITSETVTESFVPGSVGIDLDGCSNPGPMTVSGAVAGQFESAVLARASHLMFYSFSGAYCGSLIDVAPDSTGTSASPPYNINVYGFHAYHAGVAAIRVRQATSIHVWGGLNESPGGTAPDMICEAGFGGEASLREVKNIGSPRLKHYGTGLVLLENTQYREHVRVTGQGSGTPVNVSAWKALTLQNGWTVEPGFIVGEYRKTFDGDVEVRGYITGGTLTPGTVIAQLNIANHRPPSTLVFDVRISDGTSGEIRVDQDGSLILVKASSANGGWVSLNGIKWTPNH